MTDNLVTWLREQIADDEAAATGATEGPWADHLGQVLGGPDAQFLVADRAQVWNSDHIIRWNPVRVLAQCEAHRRVVDFAQMVFENVGMIYDTTAAQIQYKTLRLVALAYCDRPGYRKEWKP